MRNPALRSPQSIYLVRNSGIRHCLIAALHEHPEVEETLPMREGTKELHPELPEWPDISPKTPLGGFDLAVRLQGDEAWRYLAEFKWDELYMCLWDVFKLAHGSRLAGIEATFMIAIALERQWAAPAECAELFDDHIISTRFLLDCHEARWRNMEGSSKSRPLTLPRVLELRRVADVPIETPYGASRLRIVSVAPTQAEWLKLDADCWPLPVAESEVLD